MNEHEQKVFDARNGRVFFRIILPITLIICMVWIVLQCFAPNHARFVYFAWWPLFMVGWSIWVHFQRISRRSDPTLGNSPECHPDDVEPQRPAGGPTAPEWQINAICFFGGLIMIAIPPIAFPLVAKIASPHRISSEQIAEGLKLWPFRMLALISQVFGVVILLIGAYQEVRRRFGAGRPPGSNPDIESEPK